MSGLTPGSEFAGHRIEAVIAAGGMGVVYRATHLTLELPVALKVISPEHAGDVTFRERFRREAQVAARLDNRHVIPVRDAGEADGLLYISMRLVEGPTVTRLVSICDTLEPELAVSLTEQVADGLDAAHAAGLVHRDVKPANVLVERFPERPHAFLTDFGITRRQTVADDLTLTGKFVGSIDYVAPEQIRGEAVDGRCDVYALAGMLSFMLTGEAPYPHENSAAKLYAHLNDPPPRLPPAMLGGASLGDVIAKGMAKDPGERYATAGEFATAARAALEEAETEVLPAAATAGGKAPGTGSDGSTTEVPVVAPAPVAATAADAEPASGSGSPHGRRRLIAAGAVLATVLALAGVIFGGGGGGDGGSGDGNDGGSGTPVSNVGPTGDGGPDPAVVFTTDADAICTQIEQRVQDAYDDNGGQMVEGDGAIAALEERAKIIRGGVEKLGELSPPASKQKTFDEYTAARLEFADAIDDLREAKVADDRVAEQAASDELERIVDEKIKLGKKLGLDACADRLPTPEQQQVAALATRWVDAADPVALCRDSISSVYLDASFGGSRAQCEAALVPPPLPGGEIEGTPTGVEKVHATAELAASGDVVRVFFDWERGEWLVDGWREVAG